MSEEFPKSPHSLNTGFPNNDNRLAIKQQPSLSHNANIEALQTFDVYREQYNCLSDEVKQRMSFRSVVLKLIDNNHYNLKKVRDMQGRGHLFHINEKGEALFKDRGLEPVLYTDPHYVSGSGKMIRIYDYETDNLPRGIQSANYHEIRRQVFEDGYEMFKDDGEGNFSEEMKKASDANKKHKDSTGLFICSMDGFHIRRSYLDSGENPVKVIYAEWGAPFCGVEIRKEEFLSNTRDCIYMSIGVVRLKRVA